jgi:hypothetical protein
MKAIIHHDNPRIEKMTHVAVSRRMSGLKGFPVAALVPIRAIRFDDTIIRVHATDTQYPRSSEVRITRGRARLWQIRDDSAESGEPNLVAASDWFIDGKPVPLAKLPLPVRKWLAGAPGWKLTRVSP